MIAPYSILLEDKLAHSIALLCIVVVEAYRGSMFGGGRKFVIIVASNVEGGVMEGS